MRKFAILALLAIVGAMVPLSTTVANAENNPTGTFHFSNGIPASQSGGNIDVWLVNGGSEKVISNMGEGQGADVTRATGNYTLYVCQAGSTDKDCNGSGTVPSIGTKSFALTSGSHISVNINAAGHWLVDAADTNPTKEGFARWTINNNLLLPGPTPAAIAVCIRGDFVAKAEYGQSDEGDFELDPAAEKAPVGKIIIGASLPADCSAAGTDAPLPFAPGLNFIQTFTTSELCAADGCLDGVLVGSKAGDTTQDVAAFCAVLPQLQGVGKILDDLFLDVVPGNFETYPSPSEVQDGVEEIQKILDAGDESVTADIKDAYYESTQELRELLTGLQARFYDLKNFSTSDVESLQQGLEEPSGPTPEDQARQAELGAWFTTNCAGAVEAQPTFTG
jgi:hypothetical protein